MAKIAKAQKLTKRLEAWDESVRTARVGRTGGNWPVFAAAAGSALAMASNASANTIVTGPIGLTLNLSGVGAAVTALTAAGVGPAGDALRADIFDGLKSITHFQTKTHTTTFTPGPGNGGGLSCSSRPNPASCSTSIPHVHTHTHSHTQRRYGLLFDLNILGGSGGKLAWNNAVANTSGRPITADSFLVPQLNVGNRGVANFFIGADWKVGGLDYLGWIAVDFTSTGLVQLQSWAYNSLPGQSINTGQTSNESVAPGSAPEPSSAAMALLAAGAAGVLAWRKRRNQEAPAA
jgi:MYXO-CTERM domain-containing protein